MVKPKPRSQKGQALTALLMFLALFIVGPVAFLAYEFAMFDLCKQELKAAVDSAALAAGATVASSNSSDPLSAQISAVATAVNMFQQNSVIGYSLASATQSSDAEMTPSANQAQIYFQFLDPVSRQPVPMGSINGKIIQVTGAFGFTPTFAGYVGLGGPYTAFETSNGGLPMLDVILCFDISASMDDFTPVSIVDRYESLTTNSYQILAQGPLYTAFQCTSATGTALNASFPQELDSSGGAYKFSSAARGTNCGAKPPSLFPSTTSFTDVVVNLDGTNTMSAGTTVTSNGTAFTFPANNIGLLVEASRGNLESIATATAANVPYLTWGVIPQPGWYAAYQQGALSLRHPLQDAISSAQNFFAIMNTACDVHFGLVTFSSNVGTSATQTCTSDIGAGSIGNITDSPSSYKSNQFPSDPMSPNPPNPGIPLNPTAGTAYSNYSTVNSAVSNLVQYGGTNIAGALNAAVNEMKSTSQGGQGLSRAGANKVIILFTDGLPTESSLGGDPSHDARTVAATAETLGIPIYCIGLCLTSNLQSNQTAILTDQNNNATSGGIAGISGNGAQFFQATELSDLNGAFENVARALVQLVH